MLYGLEAVHLIKEVIKKRDAFRLRGLRKILDTPTTCIVRSNTDQLVTDRANLALGATNNNNLEYQVNQ